METDTLETIGNKRHVGAETVEILLKIPTKRVQILMHLMLLKPLALDTDTETERVIGTYSSFDAKLNLVVGLAETVVSENAFRTRQLLL